LVKPATIDSLIAQVSLNTRASAKISAIIITSNNTTMNKYMQNFLKSIQNSKAGSEDDTVKAVLCLGEIGAIKDLS